MEDLREAFRQLIEGADFDSPAKLLGNIRQEHAVVKLQGWPYSIGTNVGHADHWNHIWLAGLKGEARPKSFPDFPVVSPVEWSAVRASFLARLDEARALVQADPLRYASKSDEAARKRLLQIVIHTSYHLGQIKLLKRLLRTSGGAG